MNKRGQGGSELRVQEKRSHDRATGRICQLSAEKLRCQRRRDVQRDSMCVFCQAGTMRKAIKRLMAKALPDYLVNQVTAEVRLATRRMFTAHSARRSLASEKNCRVNIGCGKNPIQGWINLDVVSYPDVYFWGLPVRLTRCRRHGDLFRTFFRASRRRD